MANENAASVMMELAEMMTPILEGVNGYRAQALAAGFPSVVADKMALEYHSFVIQMILFNVTKGTS